MTLISRRAAVLTTLGALTAGFAAAADEYPSRSIRMIVPFPPGGTADIVARTVGARMATILRQPMVIENRVGANGNIGTEAVAKSAPDGYTILAGNTANLIVNPALYASIPFDTLKDFIPVAAVATSANILVVNPTVPASTLAEFLAYAKSRPGQIPFASGGNGSTGHIALEMLQDLGGVKFNHVPYRGGPQAVTDLIGGQVQALFFPVPAVLQHVRSGRLRALATTSPERSAVMPDVPTIAESGIGRFDGSPWFGFFVPAGTPEAVVTRLQRAVADAMATDDVQKTFQGQGIDPRKESGRAFEQLVRADLQRWGEVVRKSGAKVE